MSSTSRIRPLFRPRGPPQPRHQISQFSTSLHPLSVSRSSAPSNPKPITEIPFLPRVFQPTTYIPSWSRRRQETPSPSSPSPTPTVPKAVVRRDWNPATFFIWIFLLIGSQAIHILRVKHDRAEYVRKSEARIGMLAEVVKRLQRGEKVDVKKVLGTGKQKDEVDWEQALKEIEEEDRLWNTRLAEQDEQAKEKAEPASNDAAVPEFVGSTSFLSPSFLKKWVKSPKPAETQEPEKESSLEKEDAPKNAEKKAPPKKRTAKDWEFL
ncbi:hypothetical protein EX30DRAFT_369227 [Ascodesmis nigricans]|uniref:Uncharacterized protein n=1 Tax=Ascodesmis nigricans TaxID=341454 RepID=A0A4S2N470_9PEZI|nr:hypothetical protein EX30DRAFT_369227 [Ascodesmis nigricans]